jgi:hypothetical protein
MIAHLIPESKNGFGAGVYLMTTKLVRLVVPTQYLEMRGFRGGVAIARINARA